MTLENCNRLLAHYEKILKSDDATMVQKDLARKAAVDMRANIARKPGSTSKLSVEKPKKL